MTAAPTELAQARAPDDDVIIGYLERARARIAETEKIADEAVEIVIGVRNNLATIIEKAVAAEREACAKIADDEDQEIAYSGQDNNWKARQSALHEIAAKIRARAALAGEKREGGE